nr:hypothetical protein [Tanacetum cinerariifolium]
EIRMAVARWLRWRWCHGDGVGSEAMRMVACRGSSGVVEMVASVCGWWDGGGVRSEEMVVDGGV